MSNKKENPTNGKVNEMWAALEAYQPIADTDGHGETWALMCSEKTAVSADDAACEAKHTSFDAAVAARAAASIASTRLKNTSRYCFAECSIEFITKSYGETK
jgi:hypothetical protein